MFGYDSLQSLLAQYGGAKGAQQQMSALQRLGIGSPPPQGPMPDGSVVPNTSGMEQDAGLAALMQRLGTWGAGVSKASGATYGPPKSFGEVLAGGTDALASQDQQNLENRKIEAEIFKATDPRMQSQNLPAALQLANEYQKRLAAGDTAGANQILMFAKAADKGLVTDASGTFQQAPGYAPAIGGIEAVKSGMKQQAQKEVDATMNPIIAGGEAGARLQQELATKPLIERKSEFAKALGKNEGEKTTEIKDRIAGLPQLEETVDRLSELGKKATYTAAGKAVDYTGRQLGLEPREAAVARAEYISLVDNQILPLLRQTFGAQFTAKEGESLKETLGAPDRTPEEKDAVLRSFIEQKKATIKTMGRSLTQPQNLDDLLNNYQQRETPLPPLPPISPQQPQAGKAKFLGWQ